MLDKLAGLWYNENFARQDRGRAAEYTTWDNHNYRLRAIRYNGKLYWHKMVDGELVEFKILR